MTTLIYDGTFEGILTAVFEIYNRRLTHVQITQKKCQRVALFEDGLEIVTNQAQAFRVLKGLRQRLSAGCLQRLYAAHLAGIAGEDGIFVGFIRHAFDSQQNIEEDYGNRYVMRVAEIVRMLRREKHRLEAFTRFKKQDDGSLFAIISPDFNVLPLLIKHFRVKYAGQKWTIYDVKRKYGVYYNLHDVCYVSLQQSVQDKARLIATYAQHDEVYRALIKSSPVAETMNITVAPTLYLNQITPLYWRNLSGKI